MRRTLGLLLAASAASMAATGRKRTAPSMLMDPMLQPTEPVLYSARQMAGARALESRRKDALFRDELSQHFAGDDVMQKIEERVRRAEAKGPSRFGRKIAVRTRYFDDAIEEFCENRRLEDVQVTRILTRSLTLTLTLTLNLRCCYSALAWIPAAGGCPSSATRRSSRLTTRRCCAPRRSS
mmetsp:Transcript_44752/g.140331  ORF Transcript_44752/g.140331 Transcript_44752/m.140331 type:complete len:181 (-) Transcript_44752:162-704(-)